MLKKIKSIINSRKYSIQDLDKYKSDKAEILKQKGNDNLFEISNDFPILKEYREDSGVMSGHYFHQDLYVARNIFLNNPVKHLDIGSRTDGFVAHVAVFREIEIVDIRDQKSNVKNILFKKLNLMNMPEDMLGYCDSISSLHAIEHFGLGRYGDPIDYYGYLKAIENIHLILKDGGTFYFSVPIGPQRINFNAHRVFSMSYLLNILSIKFIIKEFSFVDDIGDFHENINLNPIEVENNFNCTYGCGIFTLIKK
jgi:SAM-dependent methyltransferase